MCPLQSNSEQQEKSFLVLSDTESDSDWFCYDAVELESNLIVFFV